MTLINCLLLHRYLYLSLSMRQLKITKSITNRESQSLEKYLQEIGKVDLLSPEEEAELARKAKQWDAWALDKLTKANLRFVVSVAKQYQNQWLSLWDLINEGNVWLVKAAQRYDETKGFKFISYAVWRIRQSILHALAENARIVRIPLNKVGSLNKINKAHSELEQWYEREPTAEEVANLLEITTLEVENILWLASRHVSLDAPFIDWEDSSLLDVLSGNEEWPDRNFVYTQSLSEQIAVILGSLNERQAEIIKLYFGIWIDSPMPMEEIAEKFGLTRERVRQMKDWAINKLRAKSRNKLLKDFLWS